MNATITAVPINTEITTPTSSSSFPISTMGIPTTNSIPMALSSPLVCFAIPYHPKSVLYILEVTTTRIIALLWLSLR
jgi:hypothetical protein